MEKTKQFLSGITFYAPSDKAPKWVVANGKIIKKELLAWLETQDTVIRFDIKVSKEKGTYYAEINNYKPAIKEEVKTMEYVDIPDPKIVEKIEYGEVINADDIPF